MKKLIFLHLLFAGCIWNLHCQDMYTNEYASLYVNENSEVYLQISNYPDDDGMILYPKDAQMPGITFKEGINVVSAPLSENINYDLTSPQKNYQFISDGSAPNSEVNFINAPPFVRNDTIFFGKGLRVNIDAFDELAGLKKIYYSLNSDEFEPLNNNKIIAKKEGLNTMRFFSEDQVGNKEHIRTSHFIVDFTPPQTVCTFTGKRAGNTVSSNSSLILECKDNLSGVKEIRYVLNIGLSKPYTTPISLEGLKDGTYFINFFATDMVGNQKSHDVPEANKSFQIDNTPPSLKPEPIGPFRINDGIIYVSENTQIKIEAEDFRAGVEKIYYSLNNEAANALYRDPISFLKNRKEQYISYRAEDKVGNISDIQTRHYIIDDTPPRTFASINNKILTPDDTVRVEYGTAITLQREDDESGLLKTYFSTENGTNLVYVREIIAQKSHFKLRFYSLDHTLNAEKPTEINFIVLPVNEHTAVSPGKNKSSDLEGIQNLQLY